MSIVSSLFLVAFDFHPPPAGKRHFRLGPADSSEAALRGPHAARARRSMFRCQVSADKDRRKIGENVRLKNRHEDLQTIDRNTHQHRGHA